MIADIALVVTAVSVIAAVFSLRQSNRERLRQFEAMYVQRYWSILDQLSVNAVGSAAPDLIQQNETDVKAIRAYIMLCEDELEMRERGYIADLTYEIWVKAAVDQIRQPMFWEAWKQLLKDEAFPYKHVKELLNQPESYDPLTVGFFRRWLRGLAGVGTF